MRHQLQYSCVSALKTMSSLSRPLAWSVSCSPIRLLSDTDVANLLRRARPDVVAADKQKPVLEKLKHYLHSAAPESKVRIVGSLAKETNIACSDIDLIMVLPGQPSHAKILDTLDITEKVLSDNGATCLDNKRINRGRFLRFCFHGVNFDVHVCSHGTEESNVILQHVTFMRKQPQGVREAAILLKYWLREVHWKPNSFLLELIAASAALSSDGTSQVTVEQAARRFFTKAAAMLASWEGLQITWGTEWQKYHKAPAPLVLDPADPTTNVADYMTVANWEELAAHARNADLGFDDASSQAHQETNQYNNSQVPIAHGLPVGHFPHQSGVDPVASRSKPSANSLLRTAKAQSFAKQRPRSTSPVVQSTLRTGSSSHLSSTALSLPSQEAVLDTLRSARKAFPVREVYLLSLGKDPKKEQKVRKKQK